MNECLELFPIFDIILLVKFGALYNQHLYVPPRVFFFTLDQQSVLKVRFRARS